MKNIGIAVCIDDTGGMLFNKRRQSRDRVLIDDLCKSARRVIALPFSSILLDGRNNAVICDDPMAEADDGDIVFIENVSLSKIAYEAKSIILYKWNRVYPSDMKLDISPCDEGFTLTESYEFEGSSHEKITKEIYRR